MGVRGIGLMDHWAVRVGEEDYYEVERDTTDEEKTNKISKIMTINGEKNGESKKRQHEGTLTCAGTTVKTDDEMLDFNRNWSDNFPKYNLLQENCQKFTRDFVEFLVGGSYEPPCPLPQAGTGAWLCGSGSHTVDIPGFRQNKTSAGKIGAIWTVLGFEIEGPKSFRRVSDGSYSGNWGDCAELSLFRIEAKMIGLRARIEPNMNSGFGIRDGQFQAKLAGFGISLGYRGGGISTALGGIGLGKF